MNRKHLIKKALNGFPVLYQEWDSPFPILPDDDPVFTDEFGNDWHWYYIIDPTPNEDGLMKCYFSDRSSGYYKVFDEEYNERLATRYEKELIKLLSII
jgi:hypothetical protein